MIWVLIKIRVKEFSIQYCQSRNRKNNNNIKKLETQINVLDQQIQSCNSKEVITEMTTERNYFKKQRDTLYQSKAIGAQIRSKVEFMEEDERFTQYFLSVEKHRQDNNCIKALKDIDITYSDDKDLLCVASTFYNELYTSEKPTVDDINTF